MLFSDDEIQGADMVDEALEYYQKYNDFFADLCLQGELLAFVSPMD